MADTPNVPHDTPRDGAIAPNVPERYRHLVEEVLRRLPPGWAGDETLSVVSSDDPAPLGFACVVYERAARAWGEVVTLYPALLDRLSEAACRWVIAHEFGHVAARLPQLGRLAGRACLYVGGRWRISRADPKRLKDLYEEAANHLAVTWGFEKDWDTFEGERSTLFGSE